jgi:ABC-type transporter Mla MlaB component
MTRSVEDALVSRLDNPSLVLMYNWFATCEKQNLLSTVKLAVYVPRRLLDYVYHYKKRV